MATRLSDLNDQKSGINVQTEGHTFIIPSCQMVLRRQRHLGVPLLFTIPVSGKEANARLPKNLDLFGNLSYLGLRWENSTTSYTYLAIPCGRVYAPKWEIRCHRSGIHRPSWVITFYGRQSLGKGLNLGKVHDAMFVLSGAISWVDKQAQLQAKPVSLGEGWWLIAQAITEWCIKPRGPRNPHSILPVSPMCSFYS